MKKMFVLFTLLGLFALHSGAAHASVSGDALGSCMVDSLTGKERKLLAQWIFFAMAAHPDIKEFSKVSVEAQAKTNEYVGKLISRLLTENCVEQVKIAKREDGQPAISGAFELVGRVAMQELMANKEVVASISGYIKFLDQEKLEKVLKEK